MPRDISLRKQFVSASSIHRSNIYFAEAINCGFIQDVKMYSVSGKSILETCDLSCNVIMKNIKDYYWLKISHNEKMTGLIADDNGFIYFKLKLCTPERSFTKMRIYYSKCREDLISVAMDKKAYKSYIKNTRKIMEPILEETHIGY